MIGVLQGSEAQMKSYHDTGELGTIVNVVYVFALQDELKCGDERNAE